uniref:Uncharacterized protein n=1 Tax=Coccolithus braarudii TaxID=221442 RepID=A0A7S0LAU4_9EUKA
MAVRSTGEWLPGLHGVGAIEPVPHEWPSGHPEHSSATVKLVAPLKVLAGHGSAADAPIGQYAPASHGSHAVVLRSGWNVPPLHCEHSEARSSAEKLPGAHSVSGAAPPAQ